MDLGCLEGAAGGGGWLGSFPHGMSFPRWKFAEIGGVGAADGFGEGGERWDLAVDMDSFGNVAFRVISVGFVLDFGAL